MKYLKYSVTVLVLMLLPILLMGAAGDFAKRAKSPFTLPVDKDGNVLQNDSLGTPLFSEAVTLSTNVMKLIYTLPTTGNNATRQFRHMMVKNPDDAAIYLCWGGSTCTDDMAKVAAATTIVFDGLFFGPINTITKIYARSVDSGAAVPEITIW